MVDVQRVLVAAGCNRGPGVAAWHAATQRYAYGSASMIVIMETGESPRALASLAGHTARVTCVSWLAPDVVLSASVDRSLRIWDHGKQSTVLTGHTGSIDAAAASHDAHLLVSAASDATLRVWRASSSSSSSGSDTAASAWQYSCVSVLDVGVKGLVLALSVIRLAAAPTAFLIASAGVAGGVISLRANTDDSLSSWMTVASLHGHRDWVRGLAWKLPTAADARSSLLLASASQDTNVRLWRVDLTDTRSGAAQDDDAALISVSDDAAVVTQQLPGWLTQFSVAQEALLAGHEAWVYSVAWQPSDWTTAVHSADAAPLCLVTASADKTAMLWRPDPATGVWVNDVRVGEVGEHQWGFYGAAVSPAADEILAYSHNGALHRWTLDAACERWSGCVVPAGHSGSVQQLAWDPCGCYLVSVAMDRTTRVWAPWRTAEPSDDDSDDAPWYEIARPQVHGYPMTCIAFVAQHSFISAGAEKIFRLFDAPSTFIDSLAAITRSTQAQQQQQQQQKDVSSERLAVGANLPPLGLSNKAFGADDVARGGDHIDAESLLDQFDKTVVFAPVVLTAPPLEERLMHKTLWPEVNKLYSHGYDISALACSPMRDVVATACQSRSEKHAGLRLWNPATWTATGELTAHSLTVVAIAFSPDATRLLAVSRDRRFSLYARAPAHAAYLTEGWTPLALVGAHKKQLYHATWAPDSRLFATCARDGLIRTWSRDGRAVATLQPRSASIGATTALAWGQLPGGMHVLASGHDTGTLRLLLGRQGDGDGDGDVQGITWTDAQHVSPDLAPAAAVRSMAIRRCRQHLDLAIGSDDHSVRVLRITCRR